MQAITADTVVAYITHDDRPNISSASSRHRAKRRGGLCSSKADTVYSDDLLRPVVRDRRNAEQFELAGSDTLSAYIGSWT